MKRALLIILSLMLLSSLTACSKDAYQTYGDAVIKTNKISKGQMSYEVHVENEFITEGLSEEEIRELNYLKRIEANTSIMFDGNEEETRVISRNYFNLGGMGFDSSFYINGDTAFIQMPILGKYVVLDEYIKEYNNDDFQPENEVTEVTIGTMEALKEEWIKVLTEEDVVSGDKILLPTENGEVKATRFSINLTDEQITQLLNNSLDIIAKDNSFKEYVNIVDENGNEMNYEEAINSLKNMASNISVKDFQYTGYIDFDGYLIQEDIKLLIEQNDKESKIVSTSFSMQSKNWDIEKEQNFEFPELTEDNILDMNNIEQGLPYIFDDFMNKNGGK